MGTVKGIALAVLSAQLLLSGCAASRMSAHPGGGVPYPLKEPPKAEEIYHVPTGLQVSFGGAMDIMAGARLVCIGETHDNLHAHRVELAIVRELFRRYPGEVAIGMEMFREPQQEVLDRWTNGELDELAFLKDIKWYDTWGSDFGYYRDILLFAKENRIDVIALNPSKELQQQVSRTGLDKLPEDVKAKLPEIDDTDPYQRAVLKAVYGGHVPSDERFNAFYRVQLLWEETMARRVVDYLRSPRGAGKRMVTITGGWHVKYGFGLPKKVVRRMPLAYTIVLPEEVSVPAEKADQVMDIDLPDIPLLSSDFTWWVPYEGLEEKRVRLGVQLAEKEGQVLVESVLPGSPAGKAGIVKGDRIFALDGRAVSDVADVFYLLGGKKMGEKGAVTIRRDEDEKVLDVEFFPLPKVKPHE